MLLRLVLSSVVLLLTGCETYGEQRVRYPAVSPDTHLIISGELAYRERIALPPESAVVIEIGPHGVAGFSWLRKIEDGRQQPFEFHVAIERSRLEPDFELRAGIAVAGKLAWAAEPIDIDPGASALHLGVGDGPALAGVTPRGATAVMSGSPLPHSSAPAARATRN